MILTGFVIDCLFSLNIIKLLMQSPMREQMNALDSQGFNCLYYAVYHGHLEVVKLLKKLDIKYQKD